MAGTAASLENFVPVQPEIQNFFVLVIASLLVFWLFRLARQTCALVELRSALRSNQIVPLGVASNVAGGPAVGNVRSQVMQVVRNHRARIPPSEMLRLFSFARVRKSSLSAVAAPSDGAIDLSFEFMSDVPVVMEVFWGVTLAADERHRHQLSREGQRRLNEYLEAQQAASPTKGASSSSGSSTGGGGGDGRHGGGSRSSKKGGPPPKTDVEMSVFSDGPSVDEAVVHSGYPFFLPQEFRAAGDRRYFSHGRHRFVLPQHERPRLDALASLDLNVAVPLVILLRKDAPPPAEVSASSARHRPAPQQPTMYTPSPSARLSGVADDLREICADVECVLYFVWFDGGTESAPLRVAEIKHVVCVPFGAYEVHDVYGFEKDPGQEDHVCTICLTDPPRITLLPCRHHCVCHECFQHVDKCPVCRAEIVAYTSSVWPAGADAAEENTVVTGAVFSPPPPLPGGAHSPQPPPPHSPAATYVGQASGLRVTVERP